MPRRLCGLDGAILIGLILVVQASLIAGRESFTSAISSGPSFVSAKGSLDLLSGNGTVRILKS